MTYDWEGTRTRRIRRIKICFVLTLPCIVVGFSAFAAGL
jgi:hypothetical protein